MSRYSDLIKADSPLIYLPLDAEFGVNDQSGNARNGTAVGGVTIGGATGPGELKGTDFDGVDDRVTTAYTPFANGIDLTFEGWANRDTHAATMAVFGGNNAATCPRLQLTAAANADVLFMPDRSGGTTSTWTAGWPGDAQWLHWMLYFNESTDTLDFLLNGVSLGTKTNATPYNAAPGAIQWGIAQTTGTPFDGKEAHVAAYAGDKRSIAGIHYNAGLYQLVRGVGPAPWYSAA